MVSVRILCPSPQGSWGKEHFALCDSLLRVYVCVCVCVWSWIPRWLQLGEISLNEVLIQIWPFLEDEGRVSTFTRQARVIIICPLPAGLGSLLG